MGNPILTKAPVCLVLGGIFLYTPRQKSTECLGSCSHYESASLAHCSINSLALISLFAASLFINFQAVGVKTTVLLLFTSSCKTGTFFSLFMLVIL